MIIDKANIGNTMEVLGDLDIPGLIVVALDSQGKVTMINSGGCKFLHCQKKEIIGSDWFTNYLPPSIKTDLRKNFQGFMGSTEQKIIDVFEEGSINQVLTTHKETKFVEWRNAALRDKEGKVIGTLSFGLDVTEQVTMQRTLRKNENVLQIISNAAEKFLRRGDWQKNIEYILQEIGGISELSRVYVIKSKPERDKGFRGSLIYEWKSSGIKALTSDPNLKNFSFPNSGLERWQRLLSRGAIICGPVETLPEEEMDFLKKNCTESLLLTPIVVNNNWWGTLGFDDCKQKRQWSPSEIRSFKTIADVIGAAIERQELAKTNRENLEKLEAMEPINQKRYQKLIDQQMEIIRLKKKLGEKPPAIDEVENL